MKPEFAHGNVRAPCPDCNGAITTFEIQSGPTEWGGVSRPGPFLDDSGVSWSHASYVLLRCASCGRGGLATVYHDGILGNGRLVDFYPLARETASLPGKLPPDITAEYREAEVCASVGAWRAGSAMLRSALEKTLKANGYDEPKRNLAQRIDDAAADGVITAARQRRAHDHVRDLGNDVLHDEWRLVTEVEYANAHHYVLRILEDLYDHRGEVEALLHEKGRLTKPVAPEHE